VTDLGLARRHDRRRVAHRVAELRELDHLGAEEQHPRASIGGENGRAVPQ